MWIPTQYVVLFVAILLLESAALFIYTLIGLLKQNALPWFIPPNNHDPSMCQNYHQGGSQQVVRGGPQAQGNAGNFQQLVPAQGDIQVITSTSVILQTSMVTFGQNTVATGMSGPHDTTNNAVAPTVLLGASGPLASSVATATTIASSVGSGMPSSAAASHPSSPESITSTIGSTSSAPGQSLAPSTNTSPSSTTSSQPGNGQSSAPPSSTAVPSSSLPLSASSTQGSSSVPSIVTLTSVVPASAPPRSTSTTVIVVPPPSTSVKS